MASRRPGRIDPDAVKLVRHLWPEADLGTCAHHRLDADQLFRRSLRSDGRERRRRARLLTVIAGHDGWDTRTISARTGRLHVGHSASRQEDCASESCVKASGIPKAIRRWTPKARDHRGLGKDRC